jgi:hypothetical protein
VGAGNSSDRISLSPSNRCAPYVKSGARCSFVGSSQDEDAGNKNETIHQVICRLSDHALFLSILLKSILVVNPILEKALPSILTDLEEDKELSPRD